MAIFATFSHKNVVKKLAHFLENGFLAICAKFGTIWQPCQHLASLSKTLTSRIALTGRLAGTVCSAGAAAVHRHISPSSINGKVLRCRTAHAHRTDSNNNDAKCYRTNPSQIIEQSAGPGRHPTYWASSRRIHTISWIPRFEAWTLLQGRTEGGKRDTMLRALECAEKSQ